MMIHMINPAQYAIQIAMTRIRFTLLQLSDGFGLGSKLANMVLVDKGLLLAMLCMIQLQVSLLSL